MPVCGVYSDGADDGDVPIWPIVVARVEYPDVPDAIAGAAREAHLALAALAPRAAVVMSRAVVEAMAKDRGITTGKLMSKIEKLEAQGLISQDMKDVADEIRLAGNEVAHGDILAEQISIDDAKDIVELTDAMLMRIYQEPAKVARVRASREARQNRQVPAQAVSYPVSG